MYEVGFFYPRTSHWVAVVRKSELPEAIAAAKEMEEDATMLPGVQVSIVERDHENVRVVLTVSGKQVVQDEEPGPLSSPEAA